MTTIRKQIGQRIKMMVKESRKHTKKKAIRFILYWKRLVIDEWVRNVYAYV